MSSYRGARHSFGDRQHSTTVKDPISEAPAETKTCKTCKAMSLARALGSEISMRKKNLFVAVVLFSAQLWCALAHAQIEVGDNDFRISFTGNLAGPDAAHAAIAYNPTDDEYLVVYSASAVFVGPGLFDRRVILAKLVDATTGAVSSDFSMVSTSSSSGRQARSPAAVYNSANNEFLVVWQEDDGAGFVEGDFEIFGQILASNLAHLGDSFRISDMGGTGQNPFGASDPAVAFNSVENEYLVVWSGDDNVGGLVAFEHEIFGQRLDENGAAQGNNDFRISDVGGTGDTLFDAFHPAVAFNSVENEYLVVWDSNDDVGGLVASKFEILGQRLSEIGTAQGDNDFRISDMGATGAELNFSAFRPAVAFNSAENEYLVVWHGDDDVGGLVRFELEIFGQRLDENGAEQGNNDFRISDTGGTGDNSFGTSDPAVAFNSVDNEYLVVWYADDNVGGLVNNEREIFGQRLNESGAAQGSNDFRISDMGGTGDNPFDAFGPAVAFSSAGNQFLVVWEGDDDAGTLADDDFEIYGQRLAKPLFADGFESGDTSAWSASTP